MYKNLNCDLLNISGRQSEIIELALTYGFSGIEIDMDDMVKRCQRGSFESASRFLTSSKLKVAGFAAPIDLDSDDEAFASQLAQLHGVAEIASRAEAKIAIATIPHGTNRLPYPEYFDVIRKRVDQIAEVLGKEGVRLALTFNVFAPEGEEKQFKFVRDVEGFTAIVRGCTSKNVAIVFDSWNWFVGRGTDAMLDQIGVQKVAAIRLSDCREGVTAETATAEDCFLPATTDVVSNVAYLQKFVDAELKLPVAAMGRPASAPATRDAMVGLAQESLDKLFDAVGLPSNTRRPDMFPETSYARSY